MLINSALDALPKYVMSLLPVGLENRLDKLRRGFLWQGNRDKRTFHLVRQTSPNKKARGLGIKILRQHNCSLLMKMVVKILLQKNRHYGKK